jgi:histidine triad (HIT) family protein
MQYDKNNIFARILRKELPAKVVYENDYALAFHDIYPKAPVHILVIPKAEFISFLDYTENATPEMIKGVNEAICCVIRATGLDKNGFRVLTNAGVDGGQEVPHYHMHIFGGKSLGHMLLAE